MRGIRKQQQVRRGIGIRRDALAQLAVRVHVVRLVNHHQLVERRAFDRRQLQLQLLLLVRVGVRGRATVRVRVRIRVRFRVRVRVRAR